MSDYVCTKEGEISDIHSTLKKLAWLADPEVESTMKYIIREKQAMTIMSKKVLKIITFIITLGTFLVLLYKELIKK